MNNGILHVYIVQARFGGHNLEIKNRYFIFSLLSNFYFPSYSQNLDLVYLFIKMSENIIVNYIKILFLNT